jgi:carbohydrate kinase (thermoresistant glucokinase family)
VVVTARHVVVMGVSGSGKTTVGLALAARLDLPFADADDLHDEAAKQKMAAGTPLTDDDRWPWLDRVAAWLAAHPDGAVVTCSALKRVYRDRLRRAVPDLALLHLDGDPELLARRQAARTGHFMPTSLMPSQLATLEPLGSDERGARLDVDRPVEEVVDAWLTV